MVELNVKIADELFTLSCGSSNTLYFFSDYVTEETGGTLIAPTRAERAEMDKVISDYFDRNNIDYDFGYSTTEMRIMHEMISLELLKKDVLLVHGSAVVAGGEAYMFVARSGVGKSTHTALWKQMLGDSAYILNDDKPLIRLSDGKCTAYASPWGLLKEKPREQSAPLKAIVLLERGDSDRIWQITEKEMFPHIYSAVPRGKTPLDTAKILSLTNTLLKRAKLFRMTCTPTAEAAKTAYEALTGAGAP